MKISFKIRKLTREEINKAIQDPLWQMIRRSLKGKSLTEKIEILNKLFIRGGEAEIQVINYWNALKRAGIVK